MSKSLVIVESPAKARTIRGFLGPKYAVEASIGHIRDLPGSAAEIPAALKKERWSRLGVNVDEGFEPLYVVPAGKKEQVKKLRNLVAKAHEILLATDEDREGEAISWHLLEVLKPKKSQKVKRLVFHEITKEAIAEAIANPRDIDKNMVSAQETRRIVDRLYGYEVSPLLWKKVKPQLSAGRVQSVAVRLVVERERERMRFVSKTYWDLEALLSKIDGAGEPSFEAHLARVGDRDVASGKDFDRSGALKSERVLLVDAATASRLRDALAAQTLTVESVEEKQGIERPYAPFTTSTLQQEANRRLGFTARRAMTAAQRLYENGFITYMRTDSTALSEQAIRAARALIEENFGQEYLSASPRRYETKVKNAQEAHEAIRPAGSAFRPIESASELGADERRLYELVWKRTVACQMADARVKRTSAVFATTAAGFGDVRFAASGKTIEFAGYLRAYVEGSDNPDEALADRETILPALAAGDRLRFEKLEAASHATQPPPRLTEATLVKELEQRGIGRPSTYASIIETILDRGYVFKRGAALVPTFTAFAVVQLLEEFLRHLVDYDFTARMEDDLDSIALGEKASLDYLTRFYRGDGSPGLKPTLERVEGEIDPRQVCAIELGKIGGKPLVARVGRYGPYLQCGSRRASIPEDMAPEDLTEAKAEELLTKASEPPRSIGADPASGLPVYVKVGRFGPYLQLGDAVKDGPKPKMASLLQGMTPESVTLTEALELLALPKTLGEHPETKEPVLAANGRYGPYVLCGKETRSIPEGLTPIRITLEEALRLLREPKARGRARAPRAANAKVLGTSPVTGKDVKLLDGRYGPYVSDGATNASLPKDVARDSVDLARALDLLAARAARGPAKPRSRRRRASAKR